MENKKQLKEAIKREYAKCAQDTTYFFGKYGLIQHPVKGKDKFLSLNKDILLKHGKAKEQGRIKFIDMLKKATESVEY